MFKLPLKLIFVSIFLITNCHAEKGESEINQIALESCREYMGKFIGNYHGVMLQYSTYFFDGVGKELVGNFSNDEKKRWEKNNKLMKRGYFCNKFKGVKNQSTLEKQIMNYPNTSKELQKNNKDIKYLENCNSNYFKVCVKEMIYPLKECRKLKYGTNELEECFHNKSLSKERHMELALKHIPVLNALVENQTLIGKGMMNKMKTKRKK